MLLEWRGLWTSQSLSPLTSVGPTARRWETGKASLGPFWPSDRRSPDFFGPCSLSCKPRGLGWIIQKSLKAKMLGFWKCWLWKNKTPSRVYRIWQLQAHHKAKQRLDLMREELLFKDLCLNVEIRRITSKQSYVSLFYAMWNYLTSQITVTSNCKIRTKANCAAMRLDINLWYLGGTLAFLG